jgi:hypothetical protein
MRVRISFDALRLCLLVAAGVTSGYLWRAAFESSAPAEERLAAAPRLIEPAPTPPIVHIQPRHLTRPSQPVATQRVVRRTVVRTVHHVVATRVALPIAVKPTHVTPTPTPESKPPPAPKPPVTTTPPPAQTPTPSQVQSATPPPTTTPTVTTPPQANGTDESKPGWGKGDKNHDHDGPGGKNP